MTTTTDSPTRWGIISVGKISHDFVTALKILPQSEHQVVAVAARNLESAKDFGKQHNIPKCYGSYQELFQDTDVEVVYIGSINSQHFPLAKLAISFGKHVLCEKPLCINVKETEALIQAAKEKGVFLMEGIWSRCFPGYARLKEEITKGTVGDVLQVVASLGCPIANVDNCRLKELGGGSLLNLGIYCVQFANFVFGEDDVPEKVVAGGHLNPGGVDESISITLVYSGGRTATLMSHTRVELMNDACVIGTKGMLKVPAMFVCPTSIITPTETLHFSLPKPVPGSKFNYPCSEGLSYEAQEIRECIKNGLTESPKMKLSESLLIAELMEKARKQLGVSYEQD